MTLHETLRAHPRMPFLAMSPMARLKEFHQAMEVKKFIEVDVNDRDDLMALRRTLITEEYEEVMQEFDKYFEGEGAIEDFAKELADLMVVVFGAAELLEIPLEAVFVEVMESNMSKLGDDGKPIRREDGKILKGPNYRPANVPYIMEHYFN